MKKYWFFATLATCAAGAAGYVIGQSPSAPTQHNYPVQAYAVEGYPTSPVVYSTFDDGVTVTRTYENQGVPQAQLPPPPPPPPPPPSAYAPNSELPHLPPPSVNLQPPQSQPLQVPGHAPAWHPVQPGGHYSNPAPTHWAIAAGIAPAPQNGPAKKSIDIFDTNHDGEIGPDEIHDAAQQLKKLDKNQDGKLTSNEVRNRRENNGAQRGNSQRGNKRNRVNLNAAGAPPQIHVMGPAGHGLQAPHVMVFRADGARFSMTPPAPGQQFPQPMGMSPFAGPQQHGPSPSGPQQHGIQQHQPQPYMPGPAGPQQHGPQQHGPQQHGPQQHGPQQHGPQQHGPQHHGPGPNGPQSHGIQQHQPQPPMSGPDGSRQFGQLPSTSSSPTPLNLPTPARASEGMVELAMTFDHNRDGMLDRDELTKLARQLHGMNPNNGSVPHAGSSFSTGTQQPTRDVGVPAPPRAPAQARTPSQPRGPGQPRSSGQPRSPEQTNVPQSERGRSDRPSGDRPNGDREAERKPQRDGDQPRDRRPEERREDSSRINSVEIPEFTLDSPAADDVPPSPTITAEVDTEVSFVVPTQLP